MTSADNATERPITVTDTHAVADTTSDPLFYYGFLLRILKICVQHIDGRRRFGMGAKPQRSGDGNPPRVQGRSPSRCLGTKSPEAEEFLK